MKPIISDLLMGGVVIILGAIMTTLGVVGILGMVSKGSKIFHIIYGVAGAALLLDGLYFLGGSLRNHFKKKKKQNPFSD